MANKLKKNRGLLTIGAVFLMVISTIIPATIADTSATPGFDRGVSWKSMTPLKKVTFVNFDEESVLDDYAYLAAVPTAVFYDKNEKQIYSNPLLFYQDAYISDDDEERTLNARQGIDYFMEDWMSYCGGYIDQMTLINVPKQNIDSSWNAKNYSVIQGNTPEDIASSIALHDWSYAENAVVAVINDDSIKPTNYTTGQLTGMVLKENGILSQHFEVPKTNEVYPMYHEFTVPDGYKLLNVRSWYPSFYLDAGVPGFEGIINMSIPTGDRDMQIYCDYNGEWMMAGITNAWNAQGGMDRDKTSVYVYKSGKWSVAITDVPTKSAYLDSTLPVQNNEIKDLSLEPQKNHKIFSFKFGRYGSFLDILKNMRKVTYQVDVNMYPGTTVTIPDTPPFGCRNANFKLTWDDASTPLGFSLIGPSGEEILSTRESGVSSKSSSPKDSESNAMPDGTEADMYVERLGECLPGEHYSICVYALNDITSSTDFTVSYSWDQNISKIQGDSLSSATEGSVLASVLNAPLLYMNSSEISAATCDALYKLGVSNIILIDLGGQLSSNGKTQLSRIASISQEFTTYSDIYKYIRLLTGRNDIVFSTIDSWSYWYSTELGVAGETENALSVGPAAYIAAQHGSPVLLIDNHPELSSAVVWHNELWRRHPDGYSKLPTVSEMYLTGTRVYNFLKDQGFDEEGLETIITVADQFEIGLSWDRVFVGKGKPGRFIGSPTDLSVWISKNVFYPQIVFENPALDPTGVKLINGSSSERAGLLGLFTLWRGKIGLKITKPSQEETFQYPVLDTLICYDEKFNTRASKYWGFTYTCADGTIPGVTPSFEPIDEGVMEAVNGQKGGFLADLSGSEVQPFYLDRAGYDPVFSTNFDANMNNLNQGVLLWMINTHGAPVNGGMLMFWDVKNTVPDGYPSIPLSGEKKESNPWRGYEWLMGSTAEPDTMTSEIHGILAALAGNPTPKGVRVFTTALDWALAKRPVRDMVGKIASLPVLRLVTPDWLQDTQDYYDGVIITVFLGRFGTSWYNGLMIDDELENIHSAGVSSVACLPAGKYLHLALMRHGSVFQIMDPWATSWYSDVWQNSVPRGIALGKTVGEIYTEGISKVGIQYISEPPNWWWDLAENVCLYGDPDLRIWVPSTEYSSINHWSREDVQSVIYDPNDGFSIAGHTPFGATEYPSKRSAPSFVDPYLFIGVILGAIVVLLIVALVSLRKKKTMVK
ncbi:MAG: hypothetical protein NT038_00560 [Euryarchaeota archaeon]|nr:hypothetical protein [Euryarchaeota archaeon]